MQVNQVLEGTVILIDLKDFLLPTDDHSFMPLDKVGCYVILLIKIEAAISSLASCHPTSLGQLYSVVRSNSLIIKCISSTDCSWKFIKAGVDLLAQLFSVFTFGLP